MNKRILALCLILCMLVINFESYTNISFGATSESDYPGYNTLSVTEKNAIDILKASNVFLKNSKGMYVCIKVYLKYSQVAYDVKGKYLTSLGFGDQDYGSKEYRYLGYSYNGDKVTNDSKYNDSGGVSANSLLYKNWQRIDPNTKSWGTMSLDSEEALLGKTFISEDGTGEPNPQGYNLSHILKAKVGYLYHRTNLSKEQKDKIKSYAQVLVVPSIANDGSVKIVHRKSQTNWYNTINVNNVSKSFKPSMSITTFGDLACTQPKTKFDIESGKDSVDVYVKVNTDVKFKDALLLKKEDLFISSVVNSLSAQNPLPPNGAYKGSPLTNFTNPDKMNDVVKLTYKRSDFANVYKTISLKANAVVTPKTTVLNLTKNVSTTGSFQVKALKAGDFAPEFSIWHQGVNKTDGAVSHDKPTIDKDFAFSLKDQTKLVKDNLITNYKWYIYNELSRDFDYFSGDKDPLFTLKVSDVPRYVKNGTLQFREVVTDRLGKVYPEVKHGVQILTVGQVETIITPDPDPDPDPVPPVVPPVVPTAWVYPPKGVYAGERTFITGEATITGGIITDYEFGLAPSFMTINGLQKEKYGTFLSYDTKEDTTLIVTADDGSTDSDQGETNVLHPIRPVMKTNGVYKINRTIELDSTESFGTEFYPIDKVTWTIKPMDNQDINNIKTHDSSTIIGSAKQVIGAKPKVDFKQLGRYEVVMDVHSTCTYTEETHRTASKKVMGIITIAPDLPPVARLTVPSAVIRELEAYKMAIFDIQDLSYSTDGDTIARRVYSYRYDTNNDKSLTDEAWIVIDDGNNTQLEFKTPLVGLYEFKIAVEEGNDSFGSPFWTSADILTDNTDTQLLSEKITEVVNVAPITSIFAERKKVDVVFATDYEGTELSQLKSEIDMLVKDLYEEGIDIQVSFINDRVYSGTYKDAIYTFARLARVTYYKDYQNYANYADQFHGWVADTFNWDVKYQSDKDYIPNYGAIPVSTTIRDYDLSSGGMLNRGKYVDMSAPTDPTKKNHTTGLTTEFANGSSGFNATYSNIASSVDGFFTNLGVNSYINRDLFCIDLARVKASTYRPFADKKLYFLTKNANSLLKLDEPFKQWVKQNDIEVSAVSGGSLKDKLGGNKFKNLLLEGDSTYYQAENNDLYKLGGTTGGLPESFLTSIPQGSKGFSGMGLELQGQTPNGWVLTPTDCANSLNWMYVRDASGQVYNYLSEGGNLVKKDGGNNVVRNFGTLHSAIKLIDDTGYIYNTASGTFLILSNYVN
ncbi:MAG: hypothetical protein Q8N88_02755, partial [Nanoarchaeota archaeon]|nr:hypothetical protein [Nanoarchaeota archaeon]